MKLVNIVVGLRLFIFSLPSFGQTSFNEVDSIDYTSVNRYGTYKNGNAYPVDFNQDGFDDIVSTNGNFLEVKLNTGLNSFGETIRLYEDSNGIYSISNFVDLNNDTYPDVAIATVSGIKILFARNDAYQKAYESKESIYYGKLIINDFNKDGKPDLAFPAGNTISIINDVSSGLSSKTILYTPIQTVYEFEIIDLNKDNYLDLILSSYEKLEVLFGKPNSAFTTVFSKNLLGLSMFQVGDINLDGLLDIVCLDQANSNLYTFSFNSIQNTFTENLVFPVNSTPTNFMNFKLMDVKRNGTLDLVYSDFFDLKYKENNGIGQFLAPVVLKPNQFMPFNYRLINLNNDSQIDLFHCDNNRFEAVTFDTNGSVNMSVSDGYLKETFDVLYEDVDKDGFQDILTIFRSGSIQIRWGNSNNDYSTYSTFRIPLSCLFGAIFDADQDGLNDIVITRQSYTNSITTLMLLEGIGNRKFKEPIDWKYFYYPSKPFKSDLNKDGVMELVVFERFGNKIKWFEPGNTDYNEYFTTSKSVTITGNGNGIVSVAQDDLNKDGYVDLIAANTSSSNVSILINNMLGNFTEAILSPKGTVNIVIGVGSFDYNQDQYPDLLIATDLGNGVSELQLFINDQSANFTFHSSFRIENGRFELIDVLDIDGDNDLDFIVSSWDHLNSTIFISDNGKLTNIGSSSIENVGQSSRFYKDINADGKPDVFSVNFNGGSIFIQLNNSVKEPLAVETEITITEVDLKSVKLQFSPTSATGRIVMLTKAATLTAVPVDNYFYAFNSQFGLGGSLQTNSYVVNVGSKESLEITGLNSSTKYTVSVFEYNSNPPKRDIINYTESKVEKTFTTLNSPPKIIAPAILTSIDLKLIEIPLTIEDEDNLIGEFKFSVTSSNPTIIPMSNVSISEKGSSLVLRLQPIDYGESLIQLTVTDTAKNSSLTEVRYLSIVTSIENSETGAFEVFPNPFNSKVNVFSSNRERELKIYNMEGQVIEHFRTVPELIDLSDAPTGLYLFRTSDGKYIKTAKY